MSLARVVAAAPLLFLAPALLPLLSACNLGNLADPGVEPGAEPSPAPTAAPSGATGAMDAGRRLDATPGPEVFGDGGSDTLSVGFGDLDGEGPPDEGFFFDAGGPPAPPPDFGATITQPNPPPPISGGTLLVTKAGDFAVASDPDRNQIYLVDLTTLAVTTLALQAGDEPGRAVEDASRRVHVAARSGGVVETVDLATKQITARRPACGAPRGIAYDATGDNLYVACATGELVTLPAAGGAATSTVMVERDLRDVIVPSGALAPGGSLIVTRMKTAEVLTVTTEGAILTSTVPAVSADVESPTTAWRTIALPQGELAMVHERAATNVVSTQQGGYTQGVPFCDTSVVESTVTLFPSASGTPIANAALSDVVLPVDVAATSDGTVLAVVSAGNGETPSLGGVFLLQTATYATSATQGSCTSVTEQGPFGQATAVAFDATRRLLVQSREPAQLTIMSNPLQPGAAVPAPIVLSTVSRQDTGHAIFHSNSGGFIACASCHAEGLEDGHVWQLDTTGGRRTQSLRGTLTGTAPYHWEGDQPDIPTLTQAVYVGRMNGQPLATAQVAALQSWLFTLPAPPAPLVANPAGVAQGLALFSDPMVGCVTCHSGAMFTNNATLNVNTGGSFQVPSLIGVGWRAPFLHDGCAATLQDRFGICTDGVSHGQTAQLTSDQISDLIEYLETL